jgi:predicted flap endonuclease-1-like 5' DNA nuclease
MDGYRERVEGKRVVVRRDGSLTVTTDFFDPTLGNQRNESPGRARRSDARPYGMDGASMGAQERLDRARRARGEGPEDDEVDEDERSNSNSNLMDPAGIVRPLPARPAPRARARLAPLSSASKRAAAAATTGRRVVRSNHPSASSLPPGESPPPRSGDDGTPVAKKGESLSGLKGMGPGSVAALAEIGVHTVGDLAAMSDDAVDEAKRNRPRLKLSHLRKVARAAVEPNE